MTVRNLKIAGIHLIFLCTFLPVVFVANAGISSTTRFIADGLGQDPFEFLVSALVGVLLVVTGYFHIPSKIIRKYGI